MSYNSYSKRRNSVHKVEFYKTPDGEQPIDNFLDSLNGKMAAKIVGLLKILEEKGTELRKPYTKYLKDGIFELRCKFGTDITRVLFFFYEDGKIVVTNGFVKKSQKTPKGEIVLAKRRRLDWINRYETGSEV